MREYVTTCLHTWWMDQICMRHCCGTSTSIFANMHVCMYYLCMHVCMYVCMDVLMYVCEHICTCMCACTYISIYTYIHIVRVCVCASVGVHGRIPACCVQVCVIHISLFMLIDRQVCSGIPQQMKIESCFANAHLPEYIRNSAASIGSWGALEILAGVQMHRFVQKQQSSPPCSGLKPPRGPTTTDSTRALLSQT